MTPNLQALVHDLGQLLKAKNLLLATAESCTGGLIAALITSIPGSSAWFDRGFVTYSNAAKQEMLGVQKSTLEQYGAVSEQTAIEMALGCLQYSQAQLSVAVTGIAGPEGGSIEKPVGTVWFGWGKKSQGIWQTQTKQFNGNRAVIREQAATLALTRLVKLARTS